MNDENSTITGFKTDAAKKKSAINRNITALIELTKTDNKIFTSTPNLTRKRMEFSLSKNLKNDPNLFLTMDYDSGYISHNHESNSDSSLENVGDGSSSTVSKQMFLSEDALLEKPEFTTKLNTPNSKTNEADSPGSILSASVESKETSYSVFNETDSDESVEISNIDKIVVRNLNDFAKNFKSQTIENQLVCDEIIDPSFSSERNEDNLNNFSGKFENDSSNEPVLNTCDSALKNSEVEAIKKLTLVFSKQQKENVYSVKRKYPSLSPRKTPLNKCDSSVSYSESESASDRSYSFNESESTCDEITAAQLESQDSLLLNEKRVISKYCQDSDIPKEEFNVSLSLDDVKDEFSTNCSDYQTETTEDSLLLNEKDIISKNCQNSVVSEQELNKSLSLEDIKIESSTNFSDYQTETTKDSLLLNEKDVISKHSQNLIVRKEELNASSTLDDLKDENNKKEELNKTSFVRTPQKVYKNPINAEVSPDLFEEEEKDKVIAVKEIKEISKAVAEEKYILRKDQRFLRRVQNSLKGVLPPQSVTVSQLSVDEILNKLEVNREYFWDVPANRVKKVMETKRWNDGEKINDGLLNVSNESVEDGFSSLLVTGSLEDCEVDKFPKVLGKRYYGLHHNSSKISEQIEDLCLKYAQRYVGAETQSSCTIFEGNYVTVGKPKQRWAAKSPGRRLSHLARRRITFSSASLQAGGSGVSSGSRTRQILVDAKKLNMFRRKSPRKSPRKTPKKTPGKSPRNKTRTPSSSAKKKLAMRFRKLTGEIEKTLPGASTDGLSMSSKRALFQSPDRDKKSSLIVPSTSGVFAFDNDLRKPTTKRALFASPSKKSPLKRSPFKRSPFKRLDLGFEKKRKRTDSEGAPPSKLPRSSSSIEIRPYNPELRSLNRTASDMNLTLNRGQIGELSDIHKKKLQWAVYEALRSQNIASTHPEFKLFASVLARVTRRFLPNLAANAPRPEGGTSERMFRIARHHVYGVVKGRSVEEIISDYLKNRMKTARPQGYVAPSDFGRSSGSFSDKENLNLSVSSLRGSVGGTGSEKKRIDDLGVNASKSKGCENRIDRIKKVINFGDDNR